MKILAIFFLAALLGCYGDESCIAEKAQACVERLLTSLVDDSSDNEICRELQTSIECLDTSIDSCPGEDVDDEIKDGIDSLKQVRNENCAKSLSPEEEEEIKRCFEENEDYVFECMFEGTSTALEALGDKDDENLLKCGLYGLLTGCFVERIDEKCGDKAADLAMEELSDLPDEIKEACDAISEVPELRLLDEIKRKK